MGSRYVRAACGHDVRVGWAKNTLGRSATNDIVKAGEASECWKCQCERERREAGEHAVKVGLPDLAGSVKQIAWALCIRHGILAGATPEQRTALATHTGAAWWIDHRKNHDNMLRAVDESPGVILYERKAGILPLAEREAKLAAWRAQSESEYQEAGPTAEQEADITADLARDYIADLVA